MSPLGGEQHHTQPSSSLKSTSVEIEQSPVDNNEPLRHFIQLQPPVTTDECLHQQGTMMEHPFVDEEQQEENSTSHAADVDKLLQDTDERLIRLTHAITQELHVDNQNQHDAIEYVYAGGVKRTEHDQESTDSDQEKILVENTNEPYDLWAGWNVREYSDHPSSIDAAAQWRGIRSLSIDEKPASPPGALADELTLHSITKSLRSLSYASNSEEARDLVGPPTTRLTSQRPRSFSDYTLSSSTLPRPKSFSAATSSRLPSPTSSSSSPLTSSIFESPAPNNFVAHEPEGRSPHSPTSPFVSSSFGTQRMESPEPWPSMSAHVGVRPRSSSAYESSSLSSLDYQSSPIYHNTSMTYPVGGYPLQPRHTPLYPSSQHPASVFPHRYPSPHPDFRPTSTNPSTIGRHDQGTGEYSLQIDKVVTGDDQRTTLMIRNIPNKYTQQMLLSEINQHHHGQYDFFYLPIDFKNKCNMGYAFINFIEPGPSIISFYQKFDHQKWNNFNSEKVCAISYARLQGKHAMILRFQNSSLLEKHESYRPLVFHSSGPQRGQPEPFPSGKQQAMNKQKNMWNGPDLYVHPQHAALLTNAQMAMLHGFTPTTSTRFPPYRTNYHTTDSRMNMQFHGNIPAVMTRPPTNTFHNLPSYAA